jgi:tRNA(Ile)-lysidine synthase
VPLTPEGAVRDWAARRLAAGEPLSSVAVAVSGGGDSTALLHLTVEAFAPTGLAVRAVTVDHGLRPGSAEEAAGVARACAALGVPHDTLRWDGAGRGNLQERAREARRRLIGAWARERGMGAVLLGHTADDQAETVLLRLARGSGVDGLAGMPEAFRAEGAAWARPLLRVGREALRAWLGARGIAWVDDPSNEDFRFDRVRARALMEGLGALGLTRGRLLRTAEHMARARVALDARAAETAGREVREEGVGLLLPRSLLLGLEGDDTSGRVLAAALMWVGGRERRPRWEGLLRLRAVVLAGRTATLAGCRVSPEGEAVRVAAEARALAARRERRGRFADFVAGTTAD